MSNIFLLTKPVQSGKTCEIMDDISKTYGRNIINIIFVDNCILQTNQLKTRINTNNKLDKFENSEGERCLVCTTETGLSFNQIYTNIEKKNHKIIIMCSNNARIDQAYKIIKSLPKHKFNIIIDEADKNINIFARYFTNSKHFDNVQKITMVTATPDKVLSVIPEINIIKSKECNKNIYHSFTDCNFLLIKSQSTDYIEYVETVVEFYRDKFAVGQVWFVPGKVLTVSHDKIKDIFLNENFCVFVINGEEKRLYYSSTKYIELPSGDDESIGEIIGSIYKSNKLKNKKVVITGNKCINRGITIHSPQMLITHALFPITSTNKDNDYQLAGRVCGNIKTFPKYKKPLVICGRHYKETIINTEKQTYKYLNSSSNTICSIM